MLELKWLCFGAGALGTYIGGSLALAGDKVIFLEQPAAVEELRRRGLRLDLTIDPRRRTREAARLNPAPLAFCESLDEALQQGPFAAAIYALKSFDTAAATASMDRFADDMPTVCCFSNGVDNEPAIAEVLGSEKVVPATVTTAIGRLGAGDIVLEKLRGVGIASTYRLSERLLRAATTACLNPHSFSNALSMKWSKLLTNLVGNPTSAILDMTAAEIFRDAGLYELEIGMMRECLAVMRAQRIPVVDLPGIPVRALALAVRLPLWASKPLVARSAGAGRGRKMPSFHIDLHSGRGKSEVEYLHGAVVRAGRRYNVPTPINELLTNTLVAITRGETAPTEFARQPAKLLRALHKFQDSK
jgi:2-dehydropantoate 2-reductase